jgi:EmrB/QacA subfamily drug resistance transporter
LALTMAGPGEQDLSTTAARTGRGKWNVVLALASALFIMTLDSTVMNVSIDQVITDLDTTVTKMQLAIASYTLCMAALMLVGGKIGDIIGRKRAFRIGLCLFGLGAGITSVAPSIGVLIIGWSIIEACGAALMVPAISALVASNYEGRDRALCFGIIGGVVGAAAAAGPLIGGAVATALSWRWVFGAEVVIVLFLLVGSRVIQDMPRPDRIPKLDKVGAVLSASGLGLFVLGIVQSTDWGWIHPKESPEIGGTAIEPFGFSVVPFLLLTGAVLILCFLEWERRVNERGGDALLRTSMLKIPRLRSGLSSMGAMMFALGGVFFTLPLYLQIVEGKDPFDTGLHILPLSLAVVLVSFGGARLSNRVAPRRLIRVGMLTIVAGVTFLLATIEPGLEQIQFDLAMAVVGAGIGLMSSQIGNVNLSSVSQRDTSEVGGLQGTSQNLGQAMGTALIGSILLTILLGSFDNKIQDNPAIPKSVQSQIQSQTQAGIQFVPADDVSEALKQGGVSESDAKPIVDDYEDAQITALKTALGGVGVVILLALSVTRRLPTEPLAPQEPGAAAV